MNEINLTGSEPVTDHAANRLSASTDSFFRVAALQQMAERLKTHFDLPAHRQQRMARAERLYAEIEPTRQYPYQYVYFRLTEFRTDDYPDLLITGEDLRHDLWLFADTLAKSLPRSEMLPDEEPPIEPVLTLGEVSERLKVSPKTISRWRQQGLVGRRVLSNGRWQLGFPKSVVERFVELNRERVERGGKFSQLTEEEKADILRRAKRLSRVSAGTLTEVSRRIARRLGRSPETVRYTIKNFDREHPAEALFPDVTGPLSDEAKELIYNASRRQISVETLAERFRRTRTAIYRTINEVRAQRLLDQPLEAIYHPAFDERAMEAEITAPMPDADEYETQRRNIKVPKDVPPERAHLYQEPLLSKVQEQHMFRQMNFYKHKACQMRAELDPRNARIQDIERIEELQRKATAVKDKLIRCNMRLVESIAKRHVDPGDNHFELVSDGNMSLIRSVDKFDFSRGNKFSTYATWAIIKNYARSIPAEKHHKERYQTGKEETFDLAADGRSNEQEQMLSQEQSRNRVNRLLEQLDPRERLIVRMRAGLDTYSENMTLEEIGKQLGITKERVRQLNVRAMKHLELLARTQKNELA